MISSFNESLPKLVKFDILLSRNAQNWMVKHITVLIIALYLDT